MTRNDQKPSPFSVEDLRRLADTNPELYAAMMEIAEPFRDVPDEELEREVARALAEVRSENRAKERITTSSR